MPFKYFLVAVKWHEKLLLWEIGIYLGAPFCEISNLWDIPSVNSAGIQLWF